MTLTMRELRAVIKDLPDEATLAFDFLNLEKSEASLEVRSIHAVGSRWLMLVVDETPDLQDEEEGEDGDEDKDEE